MDGKRRRNHQIVTQQLEIQGWHFASTQAPDGRFAMATSAPDSCALQALLGIVIPDAQSVATAHQLIQLAVGVHGQGLGYSPSPFKSHELMRDEDEPCIGIYLDRQGQPYTGPYWTISFVGCEELTLVPHPVLDQVIQWAMTQGSQEQMLDEPRFWFATEAAHAGLSTQSVTLETREMDGLHFGIFRSGTVGYVRILNQELAALNWLFMYMDEMVAPFNLILEAIRQRKFVSALGISCIPPATHAATSQEESWTVAVNWVAAPSHVAHTDLLRILEFMIRTQILG
jgi:hypothetical protein